jgi:hypothetical protein
MTSIYLMPDGRRATLSEDRAIVVIDPEPEETDSNPYMVKLLADQDKKDYRELITTPNMLRRALRGLGPDEVIRFGISAKYEVGMQSASLCRITSESGKTIILAGRGERV